MLRSIATRISITLLICAMAGYALAPVMAEMVGTTVSGEVTTIVAADPDTGYSASYQSAWPGDISGNRIVTTTIRDTPTITSGTIITGEGKKSALVTTTRGYAVSKDTSGIYPGNYVFTGDDEFTGVSG